MISFASALLLGAALMLPPAARPHSRIATHAAESDSAPKTPRDGPPDKHRIASDIELFAVCFRAGLPVSAAAQAVADSYGTEHAGGEPRQGPPLSSDGSTKSRSPSCGDS